MKTLKLILLLLFNIVYKVKCYIDLEVKNPALDNSLYESVLDSELCSEQLRYITSENLVLRAQFLDAGLRIPRGLSDFNFVDLGNYHQCLGIKTDLENHEISGKYCLLDFPLVQEIRLPSPDFPDIPWPEWAPRNQNEYLKTENFETIRNFESVISHYNVLEGHASTVSTFNATQGNDLLTVNIRLALCLPRACTTQQALSSLYFNVSNIGLKYDEVHCRLSDDKPWVAGDIVTIVILSAIGLITLISTFYEVNHSVIKKRDPKTANKIISSFSLYTNTRNFFIFKSNPGTIECLDGIRALAMAWVILGHTFYTMAVLPMINPLDAAEWISSTWSLWVQAAPLSVDTFFMLSGLLLVYTTAGKFTGNKLLCNLHVFYLNRLLRLFPVLAFGVLLQTSVFNQVSDGPLWPQLMSGSVNNCRTYWWSTLLHMQNYMNPRFMCMPHTWYVTIDSHLYILSPLVLYWVLSGKKTYAWISLACGIIVSLVSASIYIFLNNFSITTLATQEQRQQYMFYYYVNTLTRAPPFFVGMIFGYILHTWRGKKMKISKIMVALFWMLAFVSSAMTFYGGILDKKPDYDNQTLENFKHAYSRTVWAAAVGWMILACIHGYSGPLNWFLSLKQWKPLSRVSYAMYILHFPSMYTYVGSQVQVIYFAEPSLVYLFLSHFMFAVIIGFVATVVIDAPFSNFVKMALGAGTRRPPQKEPAKEVEIGAKINGSDNYSFTRKE